MSKRLTPGAAAERARIEQIIEGRLAAWSKGGGGSGNAPLADKIAVKDALTDLLAAIRRGDDAPA